MLSLPLFEKLEFLGCHLRGIDAPFGDIKLLLFGDSFSYPQLETKGNKMYPFVLNLHFGMSSSKQVQN